jgi:predicted ArsR family transcriptional regulator
MSEEGLRGGDGDLIDEERLASVGSRPARASILELLSRRDGGLSPAEMAVELGMSTSCSSYHARVLTETGRLSVVREWQGRDGGEHLYRLTELPSQGAVQRPLQRP